VIDLSIDITMRQGEFVLTVRDDGPGLSEADCERLSACDPALELARPRGTERGGLGLRIVRRIVEKHGIKFELRPREGGGLVAEMRGSIRNAGGGVVADS
jgi:two-component system osmolarity sensor histidine kinase EnvZ